MPNPYAPPENDIATPLPETTSDLIEVRAILYVHIAAILLLGCFFPFRQRFENPGTFESVFHGDSFSGCC